MRVCERFDGFDPDAPAGMYRIGVFGGTFDPIHIGHLAAGEFVRESLGLDGVIFMPAGTPVFKKDRQVTSGAQRLEMCRRAVVDNPCFDVSGMEVERGGDTYTVDTLEVLRNHYPLSVDIFFIAGADAIMDIGMWRSASRLADLARFVGITRPGYVMDDEQQRRISDELHFEVTYLETPGLNVSSSMLRQRVSHGGSIRYLTTDAVRGYIEEQGLYLKG